jgi:hypothetical protein
MNKNWTSDQTTPELEHCFNHFTEPSFLMLGYTLGRSSSSLRCFTLSIIVLFPFKFVWILFFSCLIALAMISNTKLFWSDKSAHFLFCYWDQKQSISFTVKYNVDCKFFTGAHLPGSEWCLLCVICWDMYRCWISSNALSVSLGIIIQFSILA